MGRMRLCFSLLVMAVATACPQEVFAQPSCNGAIGGGILSIGPFRPGDTVDILLQVGAGNIDEGDFIFIPEAVTTLDCEGGNNPCAPGQDCVDQGAEVSYAGDGSLFTDCIDSNGAPLGIVSNNPGGGAAPNEVTFTFVDTNGVPTDAMVPESDVCNIVYSVQIQSYSGGGSDPTTLDIEFVSFFSTAVCDNGQTGSACGTRSMPLEATCEVKVDKQVSCDEGTTWFDPGLDTCTLVGTNGVADDTSIEGCTSTNEYDVDGNGVLDAAQPVLVQYLVQNTSDSVVTLTNCVLEDSNTNLIDPAGVPQVDFFNDIAQPGTVTPIWGVITPCSDVLDLLEPDTAVLRCDCEVDADCDPERIVPGCEVADCDIATFECVTPGLTVEKLCTNDASADITITVSNTGDADLENCTVTDDIYLDDDTCPVDVGVGTPVAIGGLTTNGTFDLPIGATLQGTGSAGPLTKIAANNASVTCYVVDAYHADETQKTITAEDCDTCGALCDLTLIKQDTAGNRMPGVGFTVTGPEGTLNCTTDANGECNFPGIECGTYTVTEPTPPAGYEFVDCTPNPVDIQTNGATVTCTNRPLLCSLKIIKQDTEGNLMPGVGFTVTGPEGTLTCTTDANGECNFTDIQCGTYTVTEPTPPAGYDFVDCTPNPVDIPSNGATVTCTNEPVEGGEGCTPGYWKLIDDDPATASHQCNWAFPYDPDDDFAETCALDPAKTNGVCGTNGVCDTTNGVCTEGAIGFPCMSNGDCQVCTAGAIGFQCTVNADCDGVCFDNAFPGKTLIQVLDKDTRPAKNKLRVLGFHTVAALLNAASPDVAYEYPTALEVINMFNAVWPGSGAEYVALKSMFAEANENEGCCPLSNCFNPYGGLDDGISNCCDPHGGVGCDEGQCAEKVCETADMPMPECCGLCIAGNIGAGCTTDANCDVEGLCDLGGSVARRSLAAAVGSIGVCIAGDVGADCAIDDDCDVAGDCSSWDSACAAKAEEVCCDYICENNPPLVGGTKPGLGDTFPLGARETDEARAVGPATESGAGDTSGCGAVGLIPLLLGIVGLVGLRLVRSRRRS